MTARGMTPNEFAALARISPDRVRGMIARGELGAVNVGMNRLSKPRFVILPAHIEAWEQANRVAKPATKAKRRKPEVGVTNFYPD